MPRKNRKKNYKKKKYSVSIGKLASKKVDCLIERRIQDIAKKEALKTRQILVKRLSVGAYDAGENIWSSPIDLNFNGESFCVNYIPKSDILAGPPESMSDIPQTQQDESITPAFGTIQGAKIISSHGVRNEDFIKVTSLIASIRMRMPESASSASTLNNATIHYAFVMVTNDFEVDQTDKPDVNDILKVRSWGYDARIDDNEAQHGTAYNSRTLKRGKTTLILHDNYPNIKFAKLIYKFKTPKVIQYAPSDLDGRNPKKYKIYFVYRSNVPDDTAYVKPQFWADVKINYLDV